MDEMTITPSAEEYLNELLSNQDEDTNGIKIFVAEPGTPRAETCIAYAKTDDTYLLSSQSKSSNLIYFRTKIY